MRQLAGSRAIVTGAASGIGRCLALELARRGVELALWDVDLAGLDETLRRVEAAGGTAHRRRCDLMRPAEITLAVRETLARWGGVEILVNNAGVAYYGPADRMAPEQWDWVLGVNLLAPVQLIRELLPTMLAQGRGHVLNVASIGGLVAQTRLAAYHASKFGLVGLTEALRAEYDHRGVGFTCLCPGLTRTAFFEHAAIGRKRRRRPPRWLTIPPQRVARAGVRGIRHNRGLVLVSPMARVLWFLKRLSPGLVDFANRFRRSRRQPVTLSPPAPGAAARDRSAAAGPD